MKRILVIILTLAMLFTVSVVPSFAADEDVVLTITPDIPSAVADGTNDITVTYTIAVDVKDENVKIGSIGFTLNPPEGMTLGTHDGDDSLYYHSKFAPTGVFETCEYFQGEKKFIASGTTDARNLNYDATVMTITATIDKSKIGSFTLGADTVSFGKVDGGSVKYTYRVESTSVEVLQELTGTQAVTDLEAPVKNATPDNSVTAPTNTAATVEWFNGSTKFTGTSFAAETAYTAKVTLTPDAGYKFADGATYTLDGYTITAENGSVAGTKVLTKTFPATGSKALTGITITASPSDITYQHGDTLNTAGMEVTANYDDGSSAVITGYDVTYTSGNDYLKKGDTSVTITKGGKSATLSGLTVETKALTITGLTATDRPYDESNTSVVLTGGTLTGIVGNEVVLAAIPTTGTITPNTVGENKSVTVTKPGLSGTDASNYTLSDIDGITVNITAATIPDGVKAAITGYSGAYDGSEHDAVVSAAPGYTLRYSDSEGGTYSDTCPKVKNVSDKKTVWVEISKDNYATVKKSVTTGITAKPVTVTVNAEEITYGEDIPTFTGTAADLATGDDYAGLGMTFSAQDTEISNVGKYNVTGSGTNPNYDITVSGTNVLTINPAEYLLTVDGTQNIRIGSGLSAITVDDNKKGVGVRNEELSGIFSWFTDEDRESEAKDSDISGLKLDALKTLYWKFTLNPANTNYVSEPKIGSTNFTIVEGDPQSISFPVATVERTYGDVNFQIVATNNNPGGGAISYTSSDTNIAAVDSDGTVTIKKPGTIKITATAAAVPGKYTTGKDEYTLTIAQKPITVEIDSKTREYGAENPEFTGKLASGSAMVGTDTLASIAAYNCTATNTTVPGEVAITGTDNSEYYAINYVPEKLTITKATITVVQGDVAASKTYDGNDSVTATGTLGTSGAKNGETITASFTTAKFNDKKVGTEKTVTFSGITLGGDTKDCYTVAATAKFNIGVISAKLLTVTKGTFAVTKDYDKTTAAGTASGALALDGVIAGDTVSITSGYTVGTYASANAASEINVSLSDISLTGTDAVNYTVNDTATLPVGVINAKAITADNINAISELTYNGSAQTPEPAVTVGSNTLTKGTDFDYSYDNNTDAGTATVTVTGKNNYSGAPLKTFVINPKTINPTIEVTETATFDGTPKEPTFTVKDDATVILNTQYMYSFDNNINAGTDSAKVTIEPMPNGNYTWTSPAEKKFSIAKATAPTLTGSTLNYKVGATTTNLASISGVPANAGTTEYEIGSTTGDIGIIISESIDSSTGVLRFTLTGTGLAGNNATVPVTVTMQNYNNATANIQITLTSKDIPTVDVDDITKTYDSLAITNTDIRGTASVDGTWEFKGTPGLTNVADSGTKTVIFKPTDSTNYSEYETVITVTINKATPTGTPQFTAITQSGKTLADAALATTTGFSVPGTVAWDDAATTEVGANVAYGWTFTPNDASNYNTVSGTKVVWTQSSGGVYIPPADRAVDDCNALIKAIGTVTLDKADEIKAARAAYDKLSAWQKQKVNGSTLIAAEKALEALEEQAGKDEALKERIKDMDLVARSKMVTMKNGKKGIKVTWLEEKDGKVVNIADLDFDGIQIFRSTQRYKGYGKKPIFTTTKDAYYNTSIQAGETYFYKIRAFRVVDGVRVYTEYSSKAWRVVK